MSLFSPFYLFSFPSAIHRYNLSFSFQYDLVANKCLDERDVLANNIPDPSRTQHFAVTMWDNWSNYLYLALLDGGNMTGSHFDGKSFTSINEVNFSGGPDLNLTAISMTSDAMLYAISNDEILEYSVDTSFPSNLRYVGKVFPADD